MSGVLLLHPRAAARPGLTLATNADAGVHDARAITTTEGASMINTQHRPGIICRTASGVRRSLGVGGGEQA